VKIEVTLWLCVQIFFVFSSPLNIDSPAELGQDMNASIAAHGDGVKDVAFAVDDVRGIYAEAISRGADRIREPTELTDEHGTVVIATIKTYGDTVHSFVQRNGYKVRWFPPVGGLSALATCLAHGFLCSRALSCPVTVHLPSSIRFHPSHLTLG
jgi:4-hydroxyphenylpyruvate dioxygenase-like putative hemolysin